MAGDSLAPRLRRGASGPSVLNSSMRTAKAWCAISGGSRKIPGWKPAPGGGADCGGRGPVFSVQRVEDPPGIL